MDWCSIDYERFPRYEDLLSSPVVRKKSSTASKRRMFSEPGRALPLSLSCECGSRQPAPVCRRLQMLTRVKTEPASRGEMCCLVILSNKVGFGNVVGISRAAARAGERKGSFLQTQPSVNCHQVCHLVCHQLCHQLCHHLTSSSISPLVLSGLPFFPLCCIMPLVPVQRCHITINSRLIWSSCCCRKRQSWFAPPVACSWWCQGT